MRLFYFFNLPYYYFFYFSYYYYFIFYYYFFNHYYYLTHCLSAFLICFCFAVFFFFTAIIIAILKCCGWTDQWSRFFLKEVVCLRCLIKNKFLFIKFTLSLGFNIPRIFIIYRILLTIIISFYGRTLAI